MTQRHFVSLGMFIVDQFLFEDEDGNPTGRSLDPQVGPRRHDGDNVSHFLCSYVPVTYLFLQPRLERRLGAGEPMPLSELGSGQSPMLWDRCLHGLIA